mgnify:CR=1 FL=1
MTLKLQTKNIQINITTAKSSPSIAKNNSNMSTPDRFVMVESATIEVKNSILIVNILIRSGKMTLFLLNNMAVGLWGVLEVATIMKKNIEKTNINMTI